MKWPFQKDPLDDFWKQIEWDDSFKQLMTITDDERLCDRIAALVEEDRPLAAFDDKEPDLCIRLVWGAKGPLDNNGFGCLFNCDGKPADPNPSNTRRAFEVLGLSKAALAFDIAFSAFGDSVPPIDVEQRMKIWNAADQSLRQRADDAWYEQDDEVAPAVAAFIRNRRKGAAASLRVRSQMARQPVQGHVRGHRRRGAKEEIQAGAPAPALGDQIAFNLRSVYEKVAWGEETETARKTFGVGFGPRHPAYPKWEKWYLKNRQRLVETVRRRYTGG